MLGSFLNAAKTATMAAANIAFLFVKMAFAITTAYKSNMDKGSMDNGDEERWACNKCQAIKLF